MKRWNPDPLGLLAVLLTVGVWAQMAAIEFVNFRMLAWYAQAFVAAILGIVAARKRSRWWVASVVFSLGTILLLVVADWEPFSW